MIPWFPGGHADPWNHVEAAMALDLGGHRADGRAGLRVARRMQRPDGAWHQYYLADSVEQDKLDANVCAYVAAGVWHHFLLTGDQGFVETMWPVVERAIDFVLDLQRPRGEIIWARHADGTPWSFALLTGSSSICHSLRCAIALAEHLGHERPDWELSAGRLADVIAHEPEAFAPKHRWAMDWYYPVLTGVVGGAEGRARLADRCDTFVMDGKGVRCVSDRPWITVAETCECALAHLAVGDRATRRGRCSAGRSSSATTTAATGPAPSSPTRPASPAASARPTPRRRSCSPPTRWPAARRRRRCSSTTTRCCRRCSTPASQRSTATDRSTRRLPVALTSSNRFDSRARQ